MKKKIITCLLLLSTTISCLTGCQIEQSSNEPISKNGFYFDTLITITIYDSNQEDLLDDCFDLASQYENLLSNTIEDSDISKINNNAGTYIEVDSRTIEVLSDALEYCELSQGTFDITIGGLTDLWNISALAESSGDDNAVDQSELPTDSEIQEELAHIDYSQVQIDRESNRVCLADPDSKIDLGGIAKGYIADQMKSYLNEHGVTEGIINLGGNILTIGPKSSGETYNIGIQYPFDDSGKVICSLKIDDGSMVTSGIYERYIKVNDKIYHHILDTNTGYPVDSDLLSVTISCTESTEGDALSTVCLALGKDKAKELIESMDGVEAIFVDQDYNVSCTSGLEDSIEYE